MGTNADKTKVWVVSSTRDGILAVYKDRIKAEGHCMQCIRDWIADPKSPVKLEAIYGDEYSIYELKLAEIRVECELMEVE